MNKRLDALLKRLDKSRTEGDVKAAWAGHLRLDYDTADNHVVAATGGYGFIDDALLPAAALADAEDVQT